jgi:thiosulfate reductase/polysulfide reductase chain A
VIGFFTHKTNPMQTGANRAKTMEMISRLEYMLTVDITMSDTAWMADLVLPAPTYLERQDPVFSFQGSSACSGMITRDPVVAPLYESRPVFWIVKELAKRLGLGKFFDFTIDELRQVQLEKLPQVAAALRRDGVYNDTSPAYGVHRDKEFRTRSTKIELYNDRYKENGVDPMPVYRPRPPAPPGRFRVVVGRNAYITQSSSTNNSLLCQLEDENSLWINPDPAGKLGIGPGDMVQVASGAGKVRLKARLTREIRPDTVYMDTGFGPLSTWLKNIYGKGACLAQVLLDKADEVSGNMAMHETLVTVTKV